jgi:DNA-binding MarR family transcriptional regulator
MLPDLVADVYEANGLLERHGDAIASRYGQSGARWKVLSAASVSPARSVPQLARRLGMTRQGVQRVADLLAADGLVEDEPNPDHARSPRLRLTAKGRATLSALTRASAGWHEALAEGLAAGDVSTAVATLGAVCRRLRELDAGAA